MGKLLTSSMVIGLHRVTTANCLTHLSKLLKNTMEVFVQKKIKGSIADHKFSKVLINKNARVFRVPVQQWQQRVPGGHVQPGGFLVSLASFSHPEATFLASPRSRFM